MKKVLPYLIGGVSLLIIGVLVYAYYRSQALEEKYRLYSNPAKITAVHYFEEGRAVAITQAEEGNRGGIYVGQKYATALYMGLNQQVSRYIKDGESIGSDEYMYVDIYDLSSSSLKPRRVDLFEAVAAYKPGYLPSTFNERVLMIDGTEYCSVIIITRDESSRLKYALDEIYLNLETGELQSREELGSWSDETPSINLSAYTNFGEKIKSYGFNIFGKKLIFLMMLRKILKIPVLTSSKTIPSWKKSSMKRRALFTSCLGNQPMRNGSIPSLIGSQPPRPL